MTAQVIAVDFGERRIPNGEYRCCILAAESDGQQIEWRMQAIDGPCHELQFSTATDDRDGELAELLEALGMEVRSSKGKVDLGELVWAGVNHLRGRWMVPILQVVGEGASIRMASRLIAPRIRRPHRMRNRTTADEQEKICLECSQRFRGYLMAERMKSDEDFTACH